MSTSWLNLTRKTAIVTGAGSGIGKVIAMKLYEQGCNVFLADKNTEAISKKIGGDSNDLCERIVYKACDVTNINQVHDLLHLADEFHHTCNGDGGRASILVNAAGITRDGMIGNISESDYDAVLDTNLKGTFLACQAFSDTIRLQELCQTGGGSIINIGSVVSERGNIGQANYAASKGGVVGLTRALAKEMAFSSSRVENASGVVRVNAILPGFIHSPMTKTALSETNQQRILRQIPLGRFGHPEDVSNMSLFLASSDRSGYVTGECWECSGAISI